MQKNQNSFNWYRLENIKIRKDYNKEQVFEAACKKYHLKASEIKEYRIHKKSIDARNKNDVHYIFTIDIKSKNTIKCAKTIDKNKVNLNSINVKRQSKYSPVIVGSGPAGLFCALVLAYNGIKPIVIERGKKVEERKKDVEEFWKTGKLNINSNAQYGEGGAGTFSDGKLNTGTHNPLCRNVLEEFVKFGAPEQILYESKPHIGTDNLIKIVASMRNEIIRLGGEFIFEETVTDIDTENNRITAVKCSKKIDTDTAVFAIGHSARDTFEMLYENKLNMEKKNFSVGLRIEHKQEMINKSQYGTKTKLKLPAADYKLAYHGKERSCYTFCMCPGGQVVATSSEEKTVVTNGMSKFARDGENANSAILVNVVPDDFKGESPLEGMNFQKDLEQMAFKLGGSNYYAPVQRVEDFIKNRKTTAIGEVKPTYKPGVTMSNLNEILPEFVSNTIKEGLEYFDKKIKGFANPDSMLTGVETRSSSPVRIIRDESLMSNIKGIYPCGEGAGYAGGIMTAAVDGIKVAIAILNN
ncbi:MAG: FAD-dependent oxidoreductase [Clostridia bacterium]|nr:FAD-dependent oxidoreductase [Clostridia bacterium]